MLEKKNQIADIIKQSLPKSQQDSEEISNAAGLHWEIHGNNNIAAGGHILITSILQSAAMPRGLEDHEDRLQDIFSLLATMNPQKRKEAVDELYKRVKEVQRLDELEQLVREMDANQRRTRA
jgi:hypothetical protein